MKQFLKRLNQKLPRIIGILRDKSEVFEDNPSFRFEIAYAIWNEPLN